MTNFKNEMSVYICAETQVYLMGTQLQRILPTFPVMLWHYATLSGSPSSESFSKNTFWNKSKTMHKIMFEDEEIRIKPKKTQAQKTQQNIYNQRISYGLWLVLHPEERQQIQH